MGGTVEGCVKDLSTFPPTGGAMNQLYGGIDLHANNSVIVLVDEQDQVVYEK